MNQNLKQLLFWVAMAWSVSSNAQLQVINLSTGWNNGVVAPNTPEDSWNVTLPNGTVVTPKACTYAAWWSESGCSRWISSAVNAAGESNSTAPGTYTYRFYFTVSTERLDCARLVINAIGADNRVTGLHINSNNYTPTMPAGDNNFNPLTQNITSYLNPAHLINGVNTLTITTTNAIISPTDLNTRTGLNFCGELRINDTDFNIHPVVTGPTTICQGSPLTFGGSLAAGSNLPTHYYWRLLECDAVGNLVSGGFYWESSWFTGVPSTNFTFPSNLNLPCNKYYMVALSAVRESGCSNWAQDLHVFNYICKPVANAGVDKTICQSECTTIGPVLPGHGVSYNWSANGTTVGTAYKITVCPEVTTTYTVTVTNNTTGCTNTDQVTVTVLPNEPRFNISTNTANNNYYTVTGTPIVTNANTVPGFGAYWSVEELDANNVSQFNIQNPTVWWPYPASCTFTGFDDYTLNYLGNINSLPGTPSLGRFVYNKTYRITRGTWNDNCDWNAYAYTLTTVKNANGDTYTVVAEETKAPDFRPMILRATTDIWQVTPNPSNGIFNISSESAGTESTIVEVFDLFGKKIESKVIEAGVTLLPIDLSGNAKGVYLMNITTDGITNTYKIILE